MLNRTESIDCKFKKKLKEMNVAQPASGGAMMNVRRVGMVRVLIKL